MNKIYLCETHQIEESQTKGFTVEIAGQDFALFLVKLDNNIHAYQNYCPHLGVSLNEQSDDFMSLEGTHIICSVHGALFEPNNGHCSAGPCRNESLTALDMTIENDKIYLLADESLLGKPSF